MDFKNISNLQWPQIWSLVGDIWSLLLQPPSGPGTVLYLTSLTEHGFGKICHHRRRELRGGRWLREREKLSCFSASSPWDTSLKIFSLGHKSDKMISKRALGIKHRNQINLFCVRWKFRGPSAFSLVLPDAVVTHPSNELSIRMNKQDNSRIREAQIYNKIKIVCQCKTKQTVFFARFPFIPLHLRITACFALSWTRNTCSRLCWKFTIVYVNDHSMCLALWNSKKLQQPGCIFKAISCFSG